MRKIFLLGVWLFSFVGANAESREDMSVSESGSVNGHTYVDLGLPSGLKWATCNVGASKPEEYGDYFAWGEVNPAPSNNYSEDNCSVYDVRTSELKERGVIDTNNELTDKYDAATSNWGKGWRMPTKDEFNELLNSCVWELTNLEGVDGYKVSSKVNSNWIFLPAAGYRGGTSSGNVGSRGLYWSSTVNESSSYHAYYLRFNSSSRFTNNNDRFYGRTVRPVSE